MMFGEMRVVDEYQLQTFIDQGFEFVTTVVDSQVTEYNVSEDAPQQPQINIGTAGYSNSYASPQRLNKTVPVVITTTRYLVRRSPAAKTLFEKKKNENNGTTS